MTERVNMRVRDPVTVAQNGFSGIALRAEICERGNTLDCTKERAILHNVNDRT